MRHDPAVTAVIPAAGFARRLGDAIAGSKEVVDIAGKPAVTHVLERLAAAGIRRAVIALRRGKWDVPAALVGANRGGVELAYVLVDETPSPVHSLAPALAFAADDVVALAFPDVLFEPPDAFAGLLTRQRATGADLVLGLFATDTPERVDMVRLDAAGRPAAIVIKQPDQGLEYSWSIAVWTPAFTRFVLHHLDAIESRPTAGHELQIGEVVAAAIRRGLHVDAEPVRSGRYLDIGTPADLARARERAATPPG